MNHGLVNGVGNLVRKDASGQARHKLLHAVLLAEHHDVVLHQDVLPPELDLQLLRTERQSVRLSNNVSALEKITFAGSRQMLRKLLA